MNTESDAVGVGRSPAELDESFRTRYWQHAVEYGVQYYVAGRFAAHAQFTPVCASILHHAVEMLLKACLAYDDSAERIRAYRYRESYGHSLPTLWQEFKRRNAALDLSAYDEIVTRLEAFETIRYPELLIEKGGLLSVGIYEVDKPVEYAGPGRRPEPEYVLMLPQIDRLAALLFQHTHFNPDFMRTQLAYGREHSDTYLLLPNATPLVPITPSQKDAEAG